MTQYYVYYGRFRKWGVAHEMGEEVIAQTEREAETLLRKSNGNIQSVYISLLGFARPAPGGAFWVLTEAKTSIKYPSLDLA